MESVNDEKKKKSFSQKFIWLIMVIYFIMGLLTGISAAQPQCTTESTGTGGGCLNGYQIGLFQFYIIISIYTVLTIYFSFLRYFRNSTTYSGVWSTFQSLYNTDRKTKGVVIFTLLAIICWFIMFFLILFTHTKAAILILGFSCMTLSLLSLGLTTIDPPYIFHDNKNFKTATDNALKRVLGDDTAKTEGGGGQKQYRPIKYKKLKPSKPSKPKPGFFKKISNYFDDIL